MSGRHIGSRTPRRLEQCANAMSTHEHPLVRYAGGCAYAERAIYRYAKISSDSRLESLEKAYVLWDTAADGFAVHESRATDMEQAAEMWRFGLRALQTQAYQPSMKMVAMLRAGETVSELQMQDCRTMTRTNVVRLGGYLLGRHREHDDAAYKRKRFDVRNELAAGLLLQRIEPLSHLVLAASLRQRHHKHPPARADLLAVATEPPHKGTIVTVRARIRLPGESRLHLVENDLLLSEQGKVWHTLRLLVDKEKGNRVNNMQEGRLDRLVGQMGERLLGAGRK